MLIIDDDATHWVPEDGGARKRLDHFLLLRWERVGKTRMPTIVAVGAEALPGELEPLPSEVERIDLVALSSRDPGLALTYWNEFLKYAIYFSLGSARGVRLAKLSGGVPVRLRMQGVAARIQVETVLQGMRGAWYRLPLIRFVDA